LTASLFLFVQGSDKSLDASIRITELHLHNCQDKWQRIVAELYEKTPSKVTSGGEMGSPAAEMEFSLFQPTRAEMKNR
jgi:hypothetical protein